MDPRFSFKSYPRVDNAFKSFNLLNYELVRHKIFEKRHKTWKAELMMYLAFSVIGITMGFIASLMQLF